MQPESGRHAEGVQAVCRRCRTALGARRWEAYVTQRSPDMDPRDLRTELFWPVGS